MEITSVEKNKKNKDRLSIFVDGKYSFSISEEDYLSMNLYEKKELTETDMTYIRDNLNFHAAKSSAVKYLSLKLRTEKEVKQKLRDVGFDNEVIDRAVEELKAIGYINNKLYVQKFIYDRSKLKPKSKKLLKLELQSKGIPSDDIDQVLNDWNIDETIIAQGLVKKKFGKYDIKDEKILKKVYMFLQHRGYSYEVIEDAIKRINEGYEL